MPFLAVGGPPRAGCRYRYLVQPGQEVEVPLVGGNTTHGVVRVGGTVRRPATSASIAVDAFLRHLNEVGYTGAPRTLGFDEQGRHVIEYVDGQILMPFVPTDPPSALRRVGGLLKDLHDAAESFTPADDAIWNVVIPPDRGDLIIHHDAAPWNLVLGNGRWVLIDWDNAGPGSRLWDLAYAAHAFVPLAPQTPVEDAARLLVALVDGYGLDERGRAGLADLLVPRTMSMYELLKRGFEERHQPWAQLWDEGHGQVWKGDADYIDSHLTRFRNALLG